MMARIRYVYLTLCLSLGVTSCVQHAHTPEVAADTMVVAAMQPALLWTDAQLDAEADSEEWSEELFDDFLYNYLQDTVLQRRRAVFPLQETMADGSVCQISEADWSHDYYFLPADYTTALYNSEAEMSINEDTALVRASVDRIDLTQQSITAYDFQRNNAHWNLVSIRNMSLSDSDLNDFLLFYARFAGDSIFRSCALSPSIHISMTDPDDESLSIDGFIRREQWPTIGAEIPSGTLMNIRYGQQYLHAKRILMEKTSMGDGMAEVFSFAKGSRGWELVGYEN